MRINLPTELLRTFLAIADGGNFSQAAEQVNRTQSAVSMQIKRLEELVGKPLLNRDRQADARLTSEGLTLVGYARRILKLNEEAVSILKRPELSGWVRIGLPDDYATRFLPEILAGFSRTYPQVQVKVTCEPSNQLVPLMKKGELDLAMTTSPELVIENALLLRREPTLWVTSNQHLQHEERPLPLALFPTDCYCRLWALKALESADIDHRIAYTSPSVLGILAAVSAGLAVSALSQSVIPEGLRPLTPSEGFPLLPDASFFLHRNALENNLVIDSLAEHIAKAFGMNCEGESCAVG
ncbi:LysR substrate-binding domain-containing protein [Geopsychrobacter electrodiphilus]|uniref:LysR substrate-binding domain-containing protein n=1 Tax=Geopsychrobacter electrodiphilus TaxID=225196 RepID=UPI000379437F|nr:LysR substrate-binding domain-containing protein [Geopsychrobacter electrodiphilus]